MDLISRTDLRTTEAIRIKGIRNKYLQIQKLLFWKIVVWIFFFNCVISFADVYISEHI